MSKWYIIPQQEDLMHFGILGMKWGVRRFQNPDGTLTLAGMQRYNNYSNTSLKKAKSKRDLDKIARTDNEIRRAQSLAAESEENKKLLKSKGIKQTKELPTSDGISDYSYTKDVGDVRIQSSFTSEDPKKIVEVFDITEKNKNKWMKEAANIIVNDKRITDLYKRYVPDNSMEQLKKVINKSAIIIDVAPLSRGSTDKITLGVSFMANPHDNTIKSAIFGDHLITVDGHYDAKSKKLDLIKSVTMDG